MDRLAQQHNQCWRISCGSVIVFGLTLQAALSRNSERDLDLVELWSGVGSIAGSAVESGFTVRCFDLHRVPGVTDCPGLEQEDITTKQGFEAALALVLGIRPGGLLHLAPECSSFAFPNSARHKRRIGQEMGDTSYGPVACGNLMGVIALFLAIVAMCRGVHVSLENPPGSMYFNMIEQMCPQFVSHMVSHIVHRCAYDRSPEPRIAKKYKWLATGSWVHCLSLACRCKGEHRQLGYRHGENAEKWTGLRAELTESGAYPKELGSRLVAAWCAASPPALCDAAVWVWHDCSGALAWPKKRAKSDNVVEVKSKVGVLGSAEHSKRTNVGTATKLMKKDTEDGPWSDMGRAAKQLGLFPCALDEPDPWGSIETSLHQVQQPWDTVAEAVQLEEGGCQPWDNDDLKWGVCSDEDAEADVDIGPGQIGSPKQGAIQ